MIRAAEQGEDRLTRLRVEHKSHEMNRCDTCWLLWDRDYLANVVEEVIRDEAAARTEFGAIVDENADELSAELGKHLLTLGSEIVRLRRQNLALHRRLDGRS